MWVLVLFLGVFGSPIHIQGNFNAKGIVICGSVETASITSADTVILEDSAEIHTVTATSARTSSLKVSTIKSPNGVLYIQGDVAISPTGTSSFIETHWVLHSHDDFEQHSEGWDSNSRVECEGIGMVLGAKCEGSIRKTYLLPRHSYIKIKAKAHMLGLWNNEALFIKADGDLVWQQTGMTTQHSMKICGEDRNAAYNIPIDILIPHSTGKLELEIGSSLDGSCLARYAIDDVSVLTR